MIVIRTHSNCLPSSLISIGVRASTTKCSLSVLLSVSAAAPLAFKYRSCGVMYSNIFDPSTIMITSTFNNSAVILLLGVGVLRYAVKLLVLLDKRDESGECHTDRVGDVLYT